MLHLVHHSILWMLSLSKEKEQQEKKMKNLFDEEFTDEDNVSEYGKRLFEHFGQHRLILRKAKIGLSDKGVNTFAIEWECKESDSESLLPGDAVSSTWQPNYTPKLSTKAANSYYKKAVRVMVAKVLTAASDDGVVVGPNDTSSSDAWGLCGYAGPEDPGRPVELGRIEGSEDQPFEGVELDAHVYKKTRVNKAGQTVEFTQIDYKVP